jgi:hypothetical protein
MGMGDRIQTDNLYMKISKKLASRIIKKIMRRPPDFIIGGHERPYLLRWFVIPRNPIINVYFHAFRRSDDDRALHDHPWINCSIILRGRYIEHTIAPGGIHRREIIDEGSIKFRWSGRTAHRIELHDGPCLTLFITGPRYRAWGFHCPEQGWIPWQQFTAPNDSGAIGAGCDSTQLHK